VSTLESEREPWRSTLLKNWPHIFVFITAGVGYFLMRDLAFSRGDSGVARVVSHVAGEQTAGLVTNCMLILKAAGFYLKKLFIPFPLNFGINHVSDLYIILGMLVGCIVVLLLIRRTLPGYFFFCAISVATSALMVPLLRITWTPLAERYMYIPAAFFLIGLMSFGYPRLKKFRYQKIMVGVIAILAAISIYGSTSRAMLWQDNSALFQDTIRKSPDFLPAQNQYAHALYVSGRQDEAAAILNSLRVPDTLINFQFGMVSKAVARIHSGDYAGAREILRETLKQPGKHEVMIIQRLLKLNEVEVKQTGLPRGAFYGEDVVLLTRLYEITSDPYVLYRLGRTHMFNNNSDKARDAFQRVVAQTTEKVYYHAPSKKLWLKLSER
jgi:tetratricopeptide (TPR) repeat protein